ncbi:fimbrial biogenesis chaperone [Luteimonas huabeiensis]|uniref:fimbrial biogenesis chaperone n=1 Tax=Luteimonas huabeiensis TaxID=1244513 RepID=UPI000463BED0|nr:fimbria/pilus periplasmic chaperone [Luteimonas huabeiensis]
MRPRPVPAGLLRLLCALALLAWTAGASATLQVAPTLVTIPAERNAQGLTLRNDGAEPMHVQVRVFAWRQADGEDILEPTEALAASPPLAEIPPRGEQLVRIVRLGPPPASTEASYRVVVDELPVHDAPGRPRSGLRFVLRYSVPVFLSPLAAAAPVLHTRIVAEDGARYVEVENSGNARAQLADMTHVAGDGIRREVAPGLAGYVLPGQRRRWRLPDAALAGSGAEIQVRIDGDPAQRALVADR